MACENKALVLGRALNLCIYDYGISVLNTGRFCARHQNIHMPQSLQIVIAWKIKQTKSCLLMQNMKRLINYLQVDRW